MGVAIKDILEIDYIDKSKLSNKKIAVDTFNMLYQFLSSIRQADGEPLKNSKGEITSHLKGLFNRLIFFKINNIETIFIFDGIAPKLKEKERELREEKKKKAMENYEIAKSQENLKDMKKFSQSLTKLNEKMIEDSKTLISLFGFPIINAPSEGEAQGSYLTKKGKVFAVSSQDFDSLLFGSKYLIRNLSVSQKRKVAGTSMYKETEIEFIDLEKNLKNLDLNIEELTILAILVGTDFNPGGIKGIGPKKALKLVKEYRGKWEELFKILDWYTHFDFSWILVYNTIAKMKTKEVEEELKFEKVQKEEVINFLTNFDFDKEILQKSLDKIKNIKSLNNFF